MGVNDYLTTYIENLSLKLIIKDRHIFLQKNYLISKKLEKSSQEVIYSSTCFNYNYMEFVGYETCEKLIWTSGESCRNTNTTRKQGNPKK